MIGIDMEQPVKTCYIPPESRLVGFRTDFDFLLSTNIHDWEEWDELDGDAY